MLTLILIWVGFLGFILRWRVGEITSSLKLVRIMLETWTLVRTHLSSFKKYVFSAKTPLILLMSAFLWKKSEFFGENSTFTQSNSMC